VTLLLSVAERSPTLAVRPNPEAQQMATDIAQTTSLLARDIRSTTGTLADSMGASAGIATYFSAGYFSALYGCRFRNFRNCNELARAVGFIVASFALILGRIENIKMKTHGHDTLHKMFCIEEERDVDV
jgi:nitrate/nitrite transporter NarK